MTKVGRATFINIKLFINKSYGYCVKIYNLILSELWPIAIIYHTVIDYRTSQNIDSVLSIIK